MQFYQCKCGQAKSWSSMGVPRCEACSTCGSDLALGPEGHRDPEPHNYVTRYSANDGTPYEICVGCMQRKTEIDARVARAAAKAMATEAKGTR